MTEPSGIEDRLDQLESRNDIMNLEADYARTWDSANAEGWAALFTDDGVFNRLDVPGSPGFLIKGRADLVKFCREWNVNVGRQHMMHSHYVSVDGDAAHSRVTFETRRAAYGDYPTFGIITGYYVTTYRRAHGAWRIENRDEHQMYTSEQRYFGLGDTSTW